MSHELQYRRAPVYRERVNPSLPDAAAAARVDSVASRSAHREQLERYISSIFRAAYGASVLEFLPLLVYLQESDAFQAALGLRSARQGTLFCEHYLARPVQDQIHETFSRQVNRSQVMELGNLVASQPGQAGRDGILGSSNQPGADDPTWSTDSPMVGGGLGVLCQPRREGVYSSLRLCHPRNLRGRPPETTRRCHPVGQLL